MTSTSTSSAAKLVVLYNHGCINSPLAKTAVFGRILVKSCILVKSRISVTTAMLYMYLLYVVKLQPDLEPNQNELEQT